MRNRQWLVWSLTVVMVLFVAGCAKKDAQLSETSSDSLLANNPTETPVGDLTPQGSVPPPEPAPAPAPTPRKTTPRPAPAPTPTPAPRPAPAPAGIEVPSGTALGVAVDALISSKTANVGDSWSGTVKENVVVDGKTVIPSGSTVSGTVAGAKPAQRGDRAMLDLSVESIVVEGRTYKVHGTTEAIIAGSTRARNLGAIAGGTGAGALIGGAIGGGKGALIGGAIGGVAAGAGVAKSQGYQVELKPGTALTFTTSEPVRIQR